MTRRMWIVLPWLAACNFKSSTPAITDAPPTIDGSLDAMIDAVDSRFTNITPLMMLNTNGTEDDPTLTGDMLEIYFDRDGDLYRSLRTSAVDPWPPALNVVELSTSAGETTPEIRADGLEIYFSSNRPGSAGIDVYRSTRATRALPWTTPANVAELSSPDDESTPTPTPDGLTMYLSKTVVGTATDVDIYRSTRNSLSEPWTTPVLATDLSTMNADTEPYGATDTTMFLVSDRPGTSGVRDIWTATRASTVVPWDTPVTVPELNSPVDEQDPWLSPDGKTIVFASVRSGNYELYQATRP